MNDVYQQQAAAIIDPPTVFATHLRVLAPRDPSASASKRMITVVDARVPSGRAQILAWDVVKQGDQDLSTFLCRGVGGEYFLLCRAATRPTMPPTLVPLSPIRAITWFDAHSTQFAERDMVR